MWPFTRRQDFEAMEERSVLDFSAFSDLLTPVHAGVAVTQDTAVNLPAVYRCVALNSDTIGSLPLDVYAKRGDTRVPYSEPPWLREPNQFQTMAEFVAMTQVSLDLDGNAFWLKASDKTGRLVALYVMAPSAVEVVAEDSRRTYKVRKSDGTSDTYSANAVVHLRSMTLPGALRGLSPIGCAKQTIGVGLAAEQFGAQFFGNGANLSAVITAPGQGTQEAAERLRDQFTKKHGGISNSHAIGVLFGGAQWVPISVKPDEAQFLEARRYTATEIANLFGTPPAWVTDSEGAKGYVTALYATLRLWYVIGLHSRITRIETAFSSLLPRPAYVKFNTNALLRMDPDQRTRFYQAAQLGEWMTRNEIRAFEDMNPVPGGDDFLHSVQWQENAPEPEPEPEPVPEAPDEEVTE